jgi:catechol 2,3-dioxygenase-like lactoylglutathione lyase family enzyme
VKVKRIVTNIAAGEPQKARHFYQELLGLELQMSLDWIITFGAREKTSAQVSFASEGGSGAPVPDLTVEVDDLEEALARFEQANIPLEYGPADEPWGVRRFFVRDPFGKLVNVLAHSAPSPQFGYQRGNARRDRQ